MNKITFRLFSLFMFFAGMILTSAAFSQNFPERGYFSSADMDPYSEGWCCRTGEVFPAPVRACEAEGGTIFPSPEEAHHYCAGRGTRGEPRYLERPQEATPITLPGPRGVQGDRPAPGIPPQSVPVPGMEPRGRMLPPEVPHIPRPDRSIQHMYPGPIHRPDSGQSGERIHGDSPVEATPITLP